MLLQTYKIESFQTPTFKHTLFLKASNFADVNFKCGLNKIGSVCVFITKSLWKNIKFSSICLTVQVYSHLAFIPGLSLHVPIYVLLQTEACSIKSFLIPILILPIELSLSLSPNLNLSESFHLVQFLLVIDFASSASLLCFLSVLCSLSTSHLSLYF